ncbi:glycosyltransferase, partial [Neobacillus drentensis]|uniref:glycosyltransferase n=1 Tax=Neobacillus drentensis TaxID=220684 RepID=UPI003001241F
MKKKIIFMIINMNVGGTEKALLNMIDEIPKDKYDITLLMLENYGEFLKYVPSEVQIEYLKGYDSIKNLLNEPPLRIALNFMKKGNIRNAIKIAYFYLISKLTKNRGIYFHHVLRFSPVLDNVYDLAVAYAGPMDFISFFVLNKIKANKKVQWIHFDITKIGFDQHFVSKVYNKFDKIFVVSKEGKNKLIKALPMLKGKAETFHNMMSKELIVNKANKGIGFNDDFNGFRILTVGRLSKEKGQDLTIKVLAKLKENGYNVRWYCIGEGNARQEYEQLIKKYKVENDYILLGANSNPYPFMKQCDIYVQSSRHEGFCITLSEAKCFNNPIISTNFTGASEQIFHGRTGILVNFDEREMFYGIKQLLEDNKIREKISENLQNEVVD